MSVVKASVQGVEPFRSRVSAALACHGMMVVDEPGESTVRVTVLAQEPRRFRLTRRESEVMGRLVRGETNREIASGLDLAEKTVRNHIGNIFAKLGATHRAEAVALWLGLER